jgi:hypothetical protein
MTPPGTSWDPEWNRKCSDNLYRFLRALKRDCPSLEYARVLEPQARGAFAPHLVLTGWVYRPHPQLLRLARRFGFGGCRIQRVESAERTAGYMVTRYALKGHAALLGMPRHTHYIAYSGGFYRPPVDPEVVAFRAYMRALDPVLPPKRLDEPIDEWLVRCKRLGLEDAADRFVKAHLTAPAGADLAFLRVAVRKPLTRRVAVRRAVRRGHTRAAVARRDRLALYWAGHDPPEGFW